MTLPTKTKTHTITANNRSVFVSLDQVFKDVAFGVKQHIKTATGMSVKGSSNGAAAAMDGTDRWSSTGAIGAVVATLTTSGGSWIVLTSSVLGIDICFARIGSTNDQMRIAYSVGGYSIAGTPTQHPTASDEIVIKGTTVGGSLIDSTGSLDRIWSADKATDGSSIWFIVARNNALVNLTVIQKVTSAVISPATFTPSTITFDAQTSFGLAMSVGNVYINAPAANAGPVSRANNGIGGGNVSLTTCSLSIEGFAGPIVSKYTFPPELQGGGYAIAAIGIHSFTGATRGKLGNLVDIWAGLSTATLGDTYPADGSRTFLALGGTAGLVLPWDGSAFVGS